MTQGDHSEKGGASIYTANLSSLFQMSASVLEVYKGHLEPIKYDFRNKIQFYLEFIKPNAHWQSHNPVDSGRL
jgi:hypothetical protein